LLFEPINRTIFHRLWDMLIPPIVMDINNAIKGQSIFMIMKLKRHPTQKIYSFSQNKRK